MGERFNVNDQRSFYLSAIHHRSDRIQSLDRLKVIYELVKMLWLSDMEENAEDPKEEY